MHYFTPISSLLGGLLIGLAAGLFYLFNGRITGIINIFAGLLTPQRDDWQWRCLFILGLLVGGWLILQFVPNAFPTISNATQRQIILAGILVGFGTRMANGCTSGHGICGVSRLSRRSIAATVTFIISGVLVVGLKHLLQ